MVFCYPLTLSFILGNIQHHRKAKENDVGRGPVLGADNPGRSRRSRRVGDPRGKLSRGGRVIWAGVWAEGLNVSYH